MKDNQGVAATPPGHSDEPASSLAADAGSVPNAARVVKPPHRENWGADFSIFLAGSIDMGKAINWQEALTSALSHLPVTIFNPRRDDWDSSWAQDIANPQFRKQVQWELDALDHCDMIAMYFDPNGPAPISLLELGLHAQRGQEMIVCCPEGYWRRGNVQIICDRYNIPLVDNIGEFIHLVAQGIVAATADETRSGSGPQD